MSVLRTKIAVGRDAEQRACFRNSDIETVYREMVCVCVCFGKNCADCVNTTCILGAGSEDFLLLSLVSVIASTVLKGLIFYKMTPYSHVFCFLC
jgi:hypothetical protein